MYSETTIDTGTFALAKSVAPVLTTKMGHDIGAQRVLLVRPLQSNRYLSYRDLLLESQIS